MPAPVWAFFLPFPSPFSRLRAPFPFLERALGRGFLRGPFLAGPWAFFFFSCGGGCAGGLFRPGSFSLALFALVPLSMACAGLGWRGRALLSGWWGFGLCFFLCFLAGGCFWSGVPSEARFAPVSPSWACAGLWWSVCLWPSGCCRVGCGVSASLFGDCSDACGSRCSGRPPIGRRPPN